MCVFMLCVVSGECGCYLFVFQQMVRFDAEVVYPLSTAVVCDQLYIKHCQSQKICCRMKFYVWMVMVELWRTLYVCDAKSFLIFDLELMHKCQLPVAVCMLHTMFGDGTVSWIHLLYTPFMPLYKFINTIL
jgi:hypothetical protein